jgi:hypothetical protein
MRLVIIVDLSYAKHLLYMQSLLNFHGVSHIISCKVVSLSLHVRVYILSNQKSIALDLLVGHIMYVTSTLASGLSLR